MSRFLAALNARLREHPLLGASLIGAYTGETLQGLIISVAVGGIRPSDLWAVPLVFAFYGLIAFPFVGIGLLIFGIPAERILGRYRSRPWLAAVALISGGVAGKLAFFAIDHVMFFGYYRLLSINPADMGLTYGCSAGIAWCWVNRR